jgi:sugar phosphate isomerase/epimerase
MKIGVLVNLDCNIENEIKKVHDMGFEVCQLSCWNMGAYTDEIAEVVNKACKEYNVTVSTLWCGWPGPGEWDLYDGPLTLGIVPESYRWDRINHIKNGSDFAKKIGVENVATHVGYIPENPNAEQYKTLVECLKDIATYCKNNGQYFLFETGQETPVTLRRVIEDVGTGNLGINLDPANLILYGKGNPVDALDVFGEYVCDIHAKDGKYPTNGHDLGEETIVGAGKVNFPKFIETLKEIGYNGTLIIEREIWGEQQIKDINDTKIYLEELIG